MDPVSPLEGSYLYQIQVFSHQIKFPEIRSNSGSGSMLTVPDPAKTKGSDRISNPDYIFYFLSGKNKCMG